MNTDAINNAIAPLQDTVKAIYLSVDDLKVAASILYNAYVDDPLFIDIFQAEKEGYESRRINITYLFGTRNVKKK